MGNNIIGIYKITNLINGKVYIGKSTNVARRWKDELKSFRVNDHLKNAFAKYGIENFKLEVLLRIPKDMPQEYINNLEIEYIVKYDSTNPMYGYNKTYGGEGGRKTEETKIKIGESNSGEKNPMYGRTGDKNPASKRCKCIETGEEFSCGREAAEKFGIIYSNLRTHLRGRNKSVTKKKYHFIYVDE